MSLAKHVALVSDVPDVTSGQLQRVAAALQKQVTRDLSPLWNVVATVSSFDSLDDVPIGYWPMIVVKDVPNAAGVHLDSDGQPYALIEHGSTWSLTASHECLEMLVDPFGDRLVAGQSPHPDQGRVRFLVEICDPSEDDSLAYTADGVLVSDFYTPNFFDPLASPGVRYSFGGHITAPRTILSGGYLSWHDSESDHWWQQTWFKGNSPVFRDLGVFSASDPRSIREIVDAHTPELTRLSNVKISKSSPLMAAYSENRIATSSKARGAKLRDQIYKLSRTANEGSRGLVPNGKTQKRK